MTARINLHAPAAQIRRRITVPVLCYHQIRDWTTSDSQQARPYIMPPARFRAQLRYLAGHGYHTISPDRLLAHLTTGAALPSKPVLLTFDDSDEGQFTVALPELRKHHFTATFFIMTVVLGKQHYMNASQLRQLDAAHMTIGGHTWDHHRVDRYTGTDWRIQIHDSTARLRRVLGHPIRYFAYPYGAWNPAGFAHLADNGYRAAFQLQDQPVSTTAPLFTLPRMIADPYWNTADLTAHLKHPK